MNISVGLVEERPFVDVELLAAFKDSAGQTFAPGRYHFTAPIELKPIDPAGASFAVEGVTIGIGFHWERRERQVFRGALRVVAGKTLTAINDVSLEDYVSSVISSEMSALCPVELLKAHA